MSLLVEQMCNPRQEAPRVQDFCGNRGVCVEVGVCWKFIHPFFSPSPCVYPRGMLITRALVHNADQ